MSRYTIIQLRPRNAISRDVFKTLNYLYTEVSNSVVNYGGLAYSITPWIILVLSNGIGESEHRNIFQHIRSHGIEARVASTTSTNPVHAVLTAMKILATQEFYFYNGVEKPYTIGIFAFKYSTVQFDFFSEITSQLRSYIEISQLVLATGGIPLSINLHRLVSVLREDSVSYIKDLVKHVNIGVGVDYKAVDALSKAEENLLLSN